MPIHIPAIIATTGVLVTALVAPMTNPPCVRIGTVCFATVQSALDAAHDGDTIIVPAGQYPGGITIAKSVTLRGAGVGKTVITGGEHVVTVGTYRAAAGSEPTVTIAGVTITGGRATDSPTSDLRHIEARGAGVQMLPDEEWGGGNLTITDSLITDNRAAPTATLLPLPETEDGWPICPQGFCAYAGAIGAGIDAIGSLTLIRTTVSANESAGALVSDAVGAGIAFDGSLSLIDSVVTDNHAIGGGGNARYAEGGGIFGHGGSLSLLRSSVSGNESALHVTWPTTVDGVWLDTLANGGGIHIGDDATVSIVSSHIDGNRSSYDNPNGSWGAINAGAQFGLRTSLVMKDSTVSGNVLSARLGSTDASGPMGGAVEWDGDATISGSRFVGNIVTVNALHGGAGAWAAVAALSGISLVEAKTVISDSVISGSVVTATTTTGNAQILGAGLLSETDLTLDRVLITANRAAARGNGGTALGGGIATGALVLGPEEALPSALHLNGSTVTANALTGAAGVALSGGGIYSEVPVALTRSIVAGNQPDQCVGCGSAPAQHIVGPWHFTWPRDGRTWSPPHH